MRIIKVYEALVIEPAAFESGLPMLVVGTKVEVEFDNGVARVIGRLGAFGEMATLKTIPVDPKYGNFAERGENWIWEHLILEAPWAQ